MMERRLHSRPDAPPSRTRADPPRPAEHALLGLQQSAGNHATTQLVQRWIKMSPKVTLDRKAFKGVDLDQWLEQRYKAWVGRKKIPADTKTKIKAQVKSWIMDDEEHAAVDGKYFMSYKAIFDAARKQVGPAPVVGGTSTDIEMIDAAPLSPPHTPFDETAFTDVIPTFRRASSVPRVTGPPEFEDQSDEDRAERREERGKVYETTTKPFFAVVPHHRRAQDESATVPADTQHYSLGPLSYDLQGGASHRMTARGGGSAPTYSEVLNDLLFAAAPTGGAVVATHLRDALEGGTIPAVTITVKRAMAEVLAVVLGPEMSRASFALGAFTAALHHVAQGKLGLVDAFVGTNAVYLGANDGGAAALRGTIEQLKSKKKAAMTRQAARAEPVIREWLARWVQKDLEGTELEARFSEIHMQLQMNAQRFVADFSAASKEKEKEKEKEEKDEMEVEEEAETEGAFG